MRHQKRGRKFGRTSSHKKAMLMNLAINLIRHKRIRTTDEKAKELRGYVDRLITYAKREDLHGRRLIMKKLPGKNGKVVTNMLIDDILPKVKDRKGGYTRIIKLGHRTNDSANVSFIEFVDFENEIDDRVMAAQTESESEETEE